MGTALPKSILSCLTVSQEEPLVAMSRAPPMIISAVASSRSTNPRSGTNVEIPAKAKTTEMPAPIALKTTASAAVATSRSSDQCKPTFSASKLYKTLAGSRAKSLYRKKKKGGRHLISISFMVTFLVLVGIYVAFYISAIGPHIDVEHLPQNIPPYSSFWGRYVPADAVQFGFQNYTKIRGLNPSYPFQNRLLQVVKPADVISTNDVNYFLTVVFAQPNITLDITFLNTNSYLNFQAPFVGQAGFGEQVGNATLYEVAVSPAGTNSTSSLAIGWLALIPQDNAVGFAAGTTDAKQAVELSLDSATNPTTQSILSRTDIAQTLYIVGGIANHLAIGAQNFPGVVRTGEMTVTSVDSSGPYLYVKNVVAFANATAALSHYSDVTHAYLGSHKFVVYDSYVMAQEQDSLDKLGADYRLVL
jgi:hypothetical protein